MNRCKKCGLELVESPLCSACRSGYEQMKKIMEDHKKEIVRRHFINVQPRLEEIEDNNVQQETEG